MPTYRPTHQAAQAGHKLTRQNVYETNAEGGLAYPDGAGGFVHVTAAAVAQFLADGWLEACAGGTIDDPGSDIETEGERGDE